MLTEAFVVSVLDREQEADCRSLLATANKQTSHPVARWAKGGGPRQMMMGNTSTL